VKKLMCSVLWGWLALSGCKVAAAEQQIEQPCGSPYKTSYGPYDYRIYKDRIEVKRVEDYHFTPLVEHLIKPMFGKSFAPDFDYTLHTTPNHHRALASMVRNSLKLKDPKPEGARWSVDCYFIRAMTFVPDDMIVRLLYADYLTKVGGRTPEAIKQIDFVAEKTADDPFAVYNAGLLYFEAGAFDKALQQAHRAAELGLRKQELRGMLQKAGKWQDATASASPASPGPSASAPGS
jgi:hypothetical protein